MNRKRKTFVQLVGILLVGFMCFQFISCQPQKRTKIRFWHTYTGSQAVAFQNLVAEYNRTEGKDRGIEVFAYYKGTIEQLSDLLKQEKKEKLPNIIEVTDESAYLAYLNSRLANAKDYLSKNELSGYVPGLLDKGCFTADGGIYIFPIQATVDVLYLNRSIFNDLQDAYPEIQLEDLQTWQGLYDVAQQYYQWSNGSSFITIEDLTGYIIAVADQYAAPIVQKGNKGVQIVLNQEVLRNIWQFFYSGTIRGYISISENSANHQMSSGQVVCYLASTTSAMRVPSSYRNQDGIEKALSIHVNPYPSNTLDRVVVPSAVSGVAVVDIDEEMNREAYHFLHWIAQNERVYQMTAEHVSLPVYQKVLESSTVYEKLLEHVSSRNPSVFATYAEMYTRVNALEMHTIPVFYGSERFAEEISRSLLQATREGRTLVDRLVAEGTAYEEALLAAEQDIYFLNWMEALETIRNAY